MAGAISTICIVGFPPDSSARELKNLCRFLPGYEGSHVAFQGASVSSLFVKLGDAQHAQAAIGVVNGVPFDVDVPGSQVLKAEFARREMEVRPTLPLAQPASQAPPPWARAPATARPFNGVQRATPAVSPLPALAPARYLGSGGLFGPPTPAAGVGPRPPTEELKTITVLGMRDKGLAQEELQNWFQQRPGFLTLQVNERIDGMFVKFASSVFAEQAIQDAEVMQLNAEWARRNLDDDASARFLAPAGAHSAFAGTIHPAPAPAAVFGGGVPAFGGPPLKRQRPAVGGGDLDTICILGMAEKGIVFEELQAWFQQRSGFVALQVNERINGAFVKFNSHELAEQAIVDANAMNYGAEWARRNLDL